MSETKKDHDLVDRNLHVMRETAPQPPDALMSRVLADAYEVQADFKPMRASARKTGFWREVFDTIGGWPAMAGLATATVTGVWLGVFPPGFLPEATDSYLGLSDASFLIDTATGSGFDLGEEAL